MDSRPESNPVFEEPLRPGTELREYVIGRVLGRGGFGIVCQGRHRELGIQVAIKEFFPVEFARRSLGAVHPNQAEYADLFAEGLRRFVAEAKQLEAFRDCPNVVASRDLFRANGTAYVVMEYVSGMPLSALLREREAGGQPFNETDLRAVILPLLNGLSTIHQAGVYHRDIKPSNILIRNADDEPVLIDFGAAKQQVTGLTKSIAPFTPGYAAMEQVVESGEVGPWTDLYGLGAVMWRIVAGTNPPWEPPNPVPVQDRAYALMQGRADPLPAASELGTGWFSPGLLATIDACLAVQHT